MSKKANITKLGIIKLSPWVLTLILLMPGCRSSSSDSSSSPGSNDKAEAKTFKLAQSGQSLCYDNTAAVIPCTSSAGEGQDGAIQKGVAWPNPRFTAGTGIVSDCLTDNLTGLMWLKTSIDKTGWQGAVNFPTGQTFCGYSDWRLPNRNELRSLLNYSQPNQATWLMSQGFTNIPNGDTDHFLWSSSTWDADTNCASTLITLTGEMVMNDKPSAAGAVYVRSPGTSAAPAGVSATGQKVSYGPTDTIIPDDGGLQTGFVWPDPRFTFASGSESACATDSLTGLMWAKSPDPTQVAWDEALVSVNKLDLCGHTDWRMPNINELHSLVNFSTKPASWLNLMGFTNIQGHYYWTSTSFTYDAGSGPQTNYAFYVSFLTGEDGVGPKSDPKYARLWPVRGGNQ